MMRILNAHFKQLIIEVFIMDDIFNRSAPKKATNLSINSDLLRISRKFKINLSSTLEQALTELVKAKKRELWLIENRKAISSYNSHVEKHGAFSDELRNF